MLGVCKDYGKIILLEREGNSGGALSNILPVINQSANGFQRAHLHSGSPGRLTTGSS